MSKKTSAIKSAYTAEMALLEARVNDVRTRVLMIGRENRFAAGLYAGMVKGFMVGMIVSLTLLGLIFYYFVPP